MGRRGITGPATQYIAGELRAQRSRHQWTFDDIEALTGVPRSTAERALKGEGTLAIETLIALCSGMRLDVVSLVNEAAKRR